jgi:hypothetical protein
MTIWTDSLGAACVAWQQIKYEWRKTGSSNGAWCGIYARHEPSLIDGLDVRYYRSNSAA